MNKFTANYSTSNSNFIITNLPPHQKVTPYTNIIRIVQNIIMRGAPTIASVFLREKLGLDRDYLEKMKDVKYLSKENLYWTQSIKGDKAYDDFPANQFYDDLEQILNRVGFIRNLTIAECPIVDIIPEVNQVFINQQVDFYIPLLKTVIEVDGKDHQNQKVLDDKRDKAFERSGINVIRINTTDIRNKNYQHFKSEFREVYKANKEKVDLYSSFLDIPRDSFDTHIKLTSIVRFQILLLELLDRGVISFDEKVWNFNVFDIDSKHYLELALRDLELWLGNVSALFNLYIDMPHINIAVYEEVSQLPLHSEAISVKIDLFKRWDDSVKEQNVYHIRTDFDDEANYFLVKVNEPIVYSLTSETHQKYLEFILSNLFGHRDFREGQIEIIMNCLNGEDTVGLLPTGGGKSLTYQYCVMLQPAISFVVVPIKSLMLDQINNLNKKHYISHASYINSDLSPDDSSKRLRDFAAGKYFFLIISPERFQSKKFREDLSLVNRTKALSIATIDEVHCLSEWGHEFRTSYLALANTIRKLAPSARFLALTATASSKVLKDIMSELEIDSHNVITISNFTRKELSFKIIPISRSKKKDVLVDLIASRNDTTIVFTSNVNGPDGCYHLHTHIRLYTGLSTGFYSGSMPKDLTLDSSMSFAIYKDLTQKSFMNDEINVLVSTKAFGMGIDKGNIRRTIHYGIPGSLESLYQEAGRAGRDRTNSECLVLYSPDQLNDEQTLAIFGMNTDVDMLKEELKKIQGDLKTHLYFLTEGLMNIESEVNEIFTFYQAIYKDSQLEVLVDFFNENTREVQEKNIYRLALLGIVEDWTVDWKNRQFEVVFVEWNEQSIVDQLTSHIQKYDYTFSLDRDKLHSERYSDLIDHFNNSPEPFLKKVIYILLKWYNDNVIYSRKRSMLLMKQYADDFTDSESLQEKIEVYFKRNNDVYLLENIVGKRDRLKDWFRIFYVQDEGKADSPRAISTFKSLKITVSRFLESYNNDIALNLINGLLNLSTDDFEAIDGRERMSSSIREIVKLPPVERQEMLHSILETTDLFLTEKQKNLLSKELISNGLNQMSELRQIHTQYDDIFSYSSMVKTLNSKLKDKSSGGYPWET